MKPVRIQRSRQGKQISPNGLPIVYVGRPTKWGNPFRVATRWDLQRSGRDEEADQEKEDERLRYIVGNVQSAIWHYEKWLQLQPELLKALPELKGKNLSCWCRVGDPCHADVLLEISNK